MFYKKNNTEKLDIKLFENPSSEYRGTPFWSWNTSLQKDELLRQIGIFKEMGFGGFHMHSRTGLDTEYMGEEFMDMISSCCKKAENEQMLAWFYDDDRWSSGTAGGKVTEKYEFRRKRLEFFPEDKGWNTPKDEALKKGVPYLLACYDIVIDKNGFIIKWDRIHKETDAEGTKWFVYVVNEKESTWFNGNTYLDTMDREAVYEFINLTHEKYHEKVGNYFGKTVPAIFTDEPNFNHEYFSTIPDPFYKGRVMYGWSRFFEEEYLKEYGEDILDSLPLLLWNCEDRGDSVIKYNYYNLCGKLFSLNFFKVYGDWCKEHNIEFTGHLLREPNLFEQSQNVSECMRSYGFMGIPGIDILCDAKEFTTAKQTQSSVHQHGKEAMLSELYGVTNWDFDFRGHKFQGDWQTALGVTVRVPHLAWLSMAGEAKRDYPASIGYQSPWYKEYNQIETYYARLNTVLTRGKPIVRIGVVHPIESAWISLGPNSLCSAGFDSLDERFKSVTKGLIENHLDFDFISESTLTSLSSDDARMIGKMCYDAIIIPGVLSLRSSTISFLKRFSENGGKVVFMGDCPAFMDGKKDDGIKDFYEASIKTGFDLSEVSRILNSEREIGINAENGKPAKNFIYNYRQDGDVRWLFIARKEKPGALRYGDPQNDVLTPENIKITVKGEFTPLVFDALTGEIKKISFALKNGNTVIEACMHGYDSLLLQLSEKTAEFFEVKVEEKYVSKVIDFKDTVDFELSEPNVLLLDRAEFSLDGEPFSSEEELLRLDNICRTRLDYPFREGKLAQPYTMERLPAEHTLRLKFTFESKYDFKNVQFAAEDMETLSVSLNGKAVKTEITGYFTDKSIDTILLPKIKKGINIIEVSMPYGPRTNVEWCYLLGDFGVGVSGCRAYLEKMPKKIGFGDVTSQGLPFYGANITYNTEIFADCDGCFEICIPKYRGALIGVSVDGERRGSVIFPPYKLEIPDIRKGNHKVSITVFGNRNNCFGPVHNANDGARWYGPDLWRTTGDGWCYEYNLRSFGVLKSPIITLYKK